MRTKLFILLAITASGCATLRGDDVGMPWLCGTDIDCIEECLERGGSDCEDVMAADEYEWTGNELTAGELCAQIPKPLGCMSD